MRVTSGIQAWQGRLVVPATDAKGGYSLPRKFRVFRLPSGKAVRAALFFDARRKGTYSPPQGVGFCDVQKFS
ncbi:MAG: hypothetical protein LBV07_01935 [Syntrophobacterales bacterium]|jgi:hypothetical protein|nr:hypothetical protein [Syntrophobacterales bacterium]